MRSRIRRYVKPDMPSPAPLFSSSSTSRSDHGLYASVCSPCSSTGAGDALFTPADLALRTSDGVTFFVHSAFLLAKSTNQLGGLLYRKRAHSESPGKYQVLSVDVTSPVLSTVLHTIYGPYPLPHDIALEDLAAAVDTLAAYGIPLEEYLGPGAPLFQRLALSAAIDPIEVYTLAAAHDLKDLAVFSSSYSLGMRDLEISDEQTYRMGAYYLERLLGLQMNRSETLARLLLQPPADHPPIAHCGAEQQEQLSNAWQLMGAYFIWDTGPELTTSSLQVNLGGLGRGISCACCRLAFRKRLAEVLQGWGQTKRNI